MKTLGIMLATFVCLVTLPVCAGQVANGNIDVQPKWPTFAKQPENQDDQNKAASHTRTPVGKPRAVADDSLTSSEGSFPSEKQLPSKSTMLFQTKLAEAKRLGVIWAEVHGQIPVHIPGGASPDYYERLMRLVDRADATKRENLGGWLSYFQAYKAYWTTILQSTGQSADETRKSLAAASEMLAIEQSELVDVDQRLTNQRATAPDNVSNLEEIRNGKLENVAELERTVKEFGSGGDLLAETKRHAQVLIDLTARNERANAIERRLWQSIYTGMKALITNYSALRTEAPEAQPRGVN